MQGRREMGRNWMNRSPRTTYELDNAWDSVMLVVFSQTSYTNNQTLSHKNEFPPAHEVFLYASDSTNTSTNMSLLFPHHFELLSISWDGIKILFLVSFTPSTHSTSVMKTAISFNKTTKYNQIIITWRQYHYHFPAFRVINQYQPTEHIILYKWYHLNPNNHELLLVSAQL